jgi:hypothetical protein
MGDRAQVAIKSGNDKVYLYTHWNGSELVTNVKKSMGRAKDRWDDYEYLARVIFCDLVKGDENSTTGFGIGTQPHTDLSYPIPVLDCDKQIVTWEAGNDYSGQPNNPDSSFQDFI